MSQGEIDSRLPCSSETRDEYLKPLKLGDETYDELLRRLAKHERERRSLPQ